MQVMTLVVAHCIMVLEITPRCWRLHHGVDYYTTVLMITPRCWWFHHGVDYYTTLVWVIAFAARCNNKNTLRVTRVPSDIAFIIFGGTRVTPMICFSQIQRHTCHFEYSKTYIPSGSKLLSIENENGNDCRIATTKDKVPSLWHWKATIMGVCAEPSVTQTLSWKRSR